MSETRSAAGPHCVNGNCDSRVLAAADALLELLRRIRGLAWLASSVGLPSVRRLARFAHGWIARELIRVSCAPPSPRRPPITPPACPRSHRRHGDRLSRNAMSVATASRSRAPGGTPPTKIVSFLQLVRQRPDEVRAGFADDLADLRQPGSAVARCASVTSSRHRRPPA